MNTDIKKHDPDWFDNLVSNPKLINEKNLHMASGWTNFTYDGYIEFVKNHIRLINLVLSTTADAQVLEIGCGVGAFMKVCKDQESWDVKGIDIKQSILDIALKFNPESEINLSDATKIPYSNESFDVVFVPAVMGYIDIKDHSHVMQEISRVLKPGGACVISLLSEKKEYLLTMSQTVLKNTWDRYEDFEVVKIENLEDWSNDTMKKCDHVDGRYAVVLKKVLI